MKPISFHEDETIFDRTNPEKGIDYKLYILPVSWQNGQNGIITCWKMSLIERLKAFLTGKIYASILLETDQELPPLAVCVNLHQIGIEDKKFLDKLK